MDSAGIEILREKSYENYEAAMLLQNKKYYAASINRYYYSTLQAMKYAVLKNNPHFQPPVGKGSHDAIYEQYQLIVDRKSRPKATDFITMKKYRNDADYSVRHITENEFNEFFRYFMNIYWKIDKC